MRRLLLSSIGTKIDRDKDEGPHLAAGVRMGSRALTAASRAIVYQFCDEGVWFPSWKKLEEIRCLSFYPSPYSLSALQQLLWLKAGVPADWAAARMVRARMRIASSAATTPNPANNRGDRYRRYWNHFPLGPLGLKGEKSCQTVIHFLHPLPTRRAAPSLRRVFLIAPRRSPFSRRSSNRKTILIQTTLFCPSSVQLAALRRQSSGTSELERASPSGGAGYRTCGYS